MCLNIYKWMTYYDKQASNPQEKNWDISNSTQLSHYAKPLYQCCKNDSLLCLPRWLSGLRHSAHRPERSAGGAGFNPRIGR